MSRRALKPAALASRDQQEERETRTWRNAGRDFPAVRWTPESAADKLVVYRYR